MKKILEHIEHIHRKPHHVRKRIAFGVAGACTLVIALVWLVGSIGTGVFALKDTSFAQSSSEVGAITVTNDNRDQLAGAAAAVESSPNGPPRIQIIDSKSSVVSERQAEQTTIPF